MKKKKPLWRKIPLIKKIPYFLRKITREREREQLATFLRGITVDKVNSTEELTADESRHNGYEQWFSKTKPFRDSFYKYTDELFLKPFYNDHIEDHHAFGYFAPIDMHGEGFGFKTFSPAEQIATLAQYFKKKGITFIYAALPCKAAVYPHFYVKKKNIPDDQIVIPQWRKVIHEALNLGVNVVDLYPIFKKFSIENENLFTESHIISPVGAAIVGKYIAAYVEHFAQQIPKENPDLFNANYTFGTYNFSWLAEEKRRTTVDISYNGKLYAPYAITEGEIAVFGNCNSTELPSQHGLVSQMAYNLKRDVRHVGRHLPFCPSTLHYETMRALLPSSLHNIKVVVYVGFPSAAHVRSAPSLDYKWNTLLPHDNIFNTITLNNKLQYEIDKITRKKDITSASYKQLVMQYFKDSNLFDTQFYQSTYLNDKEIDPIMHYIENGVRSKFQPAPWFDPSYYLTQADCQEINPFYHYLTRGRLINIPPSLFLPAPLTHIMQ